MSGSRRLAREAVMQALYQWELNPGDPVLVEKQFFEDEEVKGADLAYFQQLWRGTCAHVDELDIAIKDKISDRKWSDVSEVERAILRLGAYELSQRPDVPYRVVINEAVELAKRFGAEHGHRFVNGVIDKLAQQWRKSEIDAQQR